MRSMKSDAVGELRERVVEGSISELALKRGEPHQPVMEAAALDRQCGQVGEFLELSRRWSADSPLFRGAHPEREIADGARAVPQRDREAAGSSRRMRAA